MTIQKLMVKKAGEIFTKNCNGNVWHNCFGRNTAKSREVWSLSLGDPERSESSRD